MKWNYKAKSQKTGWVKTFPLVQFNKRGLRPRTLCKALHKVTGTKFSHQLSLEIESTLKLVTYISLLELCGKVGAPAIFLGANILSFIEFGHFGTRFKLSKVSLFWLDCHCR